MGLFSWLKKTGAKASTSTGDSNISRDSKSIDNAEADYQKKLVHQKKIMLTGLVDGLNLDIQNFDLEYSDGQVKVYGQVTSDADKEMVISALNTADGIRNVDNRISVVAPAHQTYVVKKGDSLSKIAKAYYGDPMKYKQIFAANTDLLNDPNKIFPGQELKIPKL